jgi:cytochrome c oxidase cbb3-type subunit I/II
MPPYPWLATQRVDWSRTQGKLEALHAVGVPYTAQELSTATDTGHAQAQAIVRDLANDGATADPDSELVALIAYLQRLGRPQGAPGSPGAPATPATSAAPAAPAAPAAAGTAPATATH